ncbi:hypothetical protein IC232_05005 [Microvirga sp. BT688]|uniref:hypothetical protein n=1 Tax=Microvirga sp. TaxID=1873136 RepID=UPI0016821461|nr:hypothetical protein [Microvirga sp.]MBD2746056.1 hypothetical protein [Microvirga sp.]
MIATAAVALGPLAFTGVAGRGARLFRILFALLLAAAAAAAATGLLAGEALF